MLWFVLLEPFHQNPLLHCAAFSFPLCNVENMSINSTLKYKVLFQSVWILLVSPAYCVALVMAVCVVVSPTLQSWQTHLCFLWFSSGATVRFTLVLWLNILVYDPESCVYIEPAVGNYVKSPMWKWKETDNNTTSKETEGVKVEVEMKAIYVLCWNIKVLKLWGRTRQSEHESI